MSESDQEFMWFKPGNQTKYSCTAKALNFILEDNTYLKFSRFHFIPENDRITRNRVNEITKSLNILMAKYYGYFI